MSTSVNINHPTVLLLKKAVESMFIQIQNNLNNPRMSLKTPKDFEALSEALNLRLSADTLRRYWGCKRGYENIRLSSLNILSAFVGFQCWNDFLEHCNQNNLVESSLNTDGFDLCSDNLNIQSVVQLSWLPYRTCSLKYLGGNKFEVLNVENSMTLTKGDTLCFRTVKVGEPLKADNVIHCGVAYPFVVLGKINGIASVKVK